MRNPSNADRDRAGIGKHSLAHRALGQGVQVDVRQVNPGHYNATIQTQGNSYARRLFGEQFSADVARTGNGFTASLKPGMGQRRATRRTFRARPTTPRGPTAEQVCKAKCKLDPDPAGCYDECMGGQGTITARPSYGYGRGGAQWARRARAAGPLVPSVRCATKCPPGQVCCVDIFGKEYCCDNCGSPLCGLDITAPGGSGASGHRFRVKGAPKRATAVDRARLGHYRSF